MDSYLLVDLNPLFNNDGISTDANPADGDFDCYGQSYPAEELPESGSIVSFSEVPFHFPSHRDGEDNNVQLEGQRLDVQAACYRRLHVIGAADGGSFVERITLQYNAHEQKVGLGLTDFFARRPCFVERVAVRCSHVHTPEGDASGNTFYTIRPVIWHQVVELDPCHLLSALVLADNPCLHIFSLTLER